MAGLYPGPIETGISTGGNLGKGRPESNRVGSCIKTVCCIQGLVVAGYKRRRLKIASGIALINNMIQYQKNGT